MTGDEVVRLGKSGDTCGTYPRRAQAASVSRARITGKLTWFIRNKLELIAVVLQCQTREYCKSPASQNKSSAGANN